MQEKTNIDAVREIAYSMLLSDVKKTPLSPIIIQHPFTTTGLVNIEMGSPSIDITENIDNLRKWQYMMKSRLSKIEDVSRIFFLLNKNYGLVFLSMAKEHMSRDDYSRLLSIAWISAENPSRDSNVKKRDLVDMFREADPSILMTDIERTFIDSLPTTATIYRGLNSNNLNNVRGLSWTIDKDKAVWFARRYLGLGEVYGADISKSNILAYFTKRNESEIVVDPKGLKNIRLMENPDSENLM